MPEVDQLLLFHYMLTIILAANFQRKRRGRKRIWVHELNLSRKATSVFNRFQQLKEFHDRFHELFRMSSITFQYLLDVLRPRIIRQDTVMRAAIDPETRLCITLHFLTSGINFRQLAFIYAVGRKTVSDMVYDTCSAIWELIAPLYLKMPASHQEWITIAERFAFTGT